MLILEEIKKAILESGEPFKEIEGIGLCIPLARGGFSSKSDIDIFIEPFAPRRYSGTSLGYLGFCATVRGLMTRVCFSLH